MNRMWKDLIWLLIVILLPGTNICQGAAENVNHVEKDTGKVFITDIFSFRGGYRPQIDLGGKWQFRRDPNDLGTQLGWHAGNGEFVETVTIPGAPQAQGIGETDNFRQKHFFWNESFWVKRNFTIPQIDKDQRLWLRTGGILPAAKIYINGSYVGYSKSSRTQQRIDVTDFIKPGPENLIAVKICKLPKIRLDGMYEWLELSLMWMGIYRPISLEITDKISLLDAHLRPELASKKVYVDLVLSSPADKHLVAKLLVRDCENEIGSAQFTIPPGENSINTEVTLTKFTPWSPVHPQLYTMDISLIKKTNSKPLDKVALRFGMREIITKGERFYLNGKPIYLRCFGDLTFYPETLCPPADVSWYLPRLKIAKSYGMNSVKGCVETMPMEFIEAADEVGIMVIQEMPFGVSELRSNRYTIDKDFRDYYTRELDGLVKMTRNHPSVIAYSMSSELSFDSQTKESFNFFSNHLTRRAKQLAPDILVIDCTGYVNTLETSKGTRFTDFYASIHPKWLKHVLDESPMDTDHKRPLILHEYNWWSCYPDINSRPEYASTQLKLFWLDTLMDTAWKNGQAELLPLYRENSLWLQELCQKDGLEYARRNQTVQGFIFFLLIDYYRYSEGLLDDFWQPKTPTAQANFMKSNGDTVILLARDGQRCQHAPAHLQIPLVISNYAEENYPNCKLQWNITSGPLSQQGIISIPELAYGELTQIGSVDFDLLPADQAYKFMLNVSLHHAGRVINTNDWSFWAFPEVRPALQNITDPNHSGKIIENGIFFHRKNQPAAIAPDATLVIADCVDEALTDYLENGGKCLLFSRNSGIENTTLYYGTRTFYTLFRNIPWSAGTSGNSGTIISSHPSMYDFPHEGRCDLQFLSMIRGVLPMHFEPLRSYGITPIIRAIDHFLANRNNAYMLEFKVGTGKILVTTLAVLDKLEKLEDCLEIDKRTFGVNNTIEARYLLQCLVDYARGPYFNPTASVPKAEFLKLFSNQKPKEPPAAN